MNLSTRTPMVPQPLREKRPRSSKIIFFSCEGPVTEEKYFQILSEKIFSDISSQICLVSARRDFLRIPASERTQAQWDEQNKSSPQYVLDRLETFIKENDHIYEFDKHAEDEFWIVIDVDDHIASNKINEFKTVLQQCTAKGIQYAVTNPFFEFWLYLHHFEVCEEDRKHANRTGDSYFRSKMTDSGITMSGNGHKIPNPDDYTVEKVSLAVKRARLLHTNPVERWPQELGSHLYKLISRFYELLPSEDSSPRGTDLK